MIVVDIESSAVAHGGFVATTFPVNGVRLFRLLYPHFQTPPVGDQPFNGRGNQSRQWIGSECLSLSEHAVCRVAELGWIVT